MANLRTTLDDELPVLAVSSVAAGGGATQAFYAAS